MMLNPMCFGTYNNYIKGFYYTVQPNDTLELISKRFAVSAHQIIVSNRLTYPYTLNEGRKIFIFGIDEPIAANGGSIYTVKFGDNLSIISKKFNVSVEEIIKNNYLNDSCIFIGQKLLIPSVNLENNCNNLKIDEENDKNKIRIYPLGETPSIGTTNKSYRKFINKFSVLRKGDRNKDVLTLKRLISTLGYSNRNFDTYFDATLEQQIKEIQNEANLEKNGLVDSKVWEYIFESVNKMPGLL